MAARPAAPPWQARPAAGQHVDLPRRPFVTKAGARYSLMDDDRRFAPLAYHSPPRFVQRNIVPCGTWRGGGKQCGAGLAAGPAKGPLSIFLDAKFLCLLQSSPDGAYSTAYSLYITIGGYC